MVFELRLEIFVLTEVTLEFAPALTGFVVFINADPKRGSVLYSNQ